MCRPLNTVLSGLRGAVCCHSAPKSSLSVMADTTVSHKIDSSTSAPSSLLSTGKPVNLELCLKTAPGITRLAEIVIVDCMGQQLITTDVELFASIRKVYNSAKREGLFRIFAFMVRPNDIHYVTFGILNQRVHIFGNPPTPSLPPPVEVDEKRYHHFGYLVEQQPMPRASFYMYFWRHRPCDPQSAMFLNRLPKKLGTSMTVLSYKNSHELESGWGIHIIEGPNKAAFATLASINLILGFILAVSYNAYMGISDPVLVPMLWIAATLAMVLLAFHFHFEHQ